MRDGVRRLPDSLPRSDCMKNRLLDRTRLPVAVVLLLALLLSGCTQESVTRFPEEPNHETTEAPHTSQNPPQTDEPYVCTSETLAALLEGTPSPLPCDTAFLEWCDQLVGGEVFYRTMTESLRENGYTDDIWFRVTGRSWRVLGDLYNRDALEDNITVMNDRPGGVAELAFIGDINMADDEFCMQVAAQQENGPIDCISPSLVKKLNRADIAFCNNEFCFSVRGYPLISKRPNFRSHPDNVSFLQELGIDIVTLANNHIYDYTTNALIDTLTTLDDAGIRHIGAGADAQEARVIQYFIVNGLKIGYVSASCAEVYLRTPAAQDNQAGILAAYDPADFLSLIAQAKENADYVVAVIHAGNETSGALEETQITLAHSCIDSGADIVIGGHPQNSQSIEYYNGAPIIYSLGNFWYGKVNTECLLLQATLGVDGISLHVTPCRQTDGFTQDCSNSMEGYSALYQLKLRSPGINIDSNGFVTEIPPDS